MAQGATPSGSHRGERAPRRYDAFISHSSVDRSVAARTEAELGVGRVWFDRSDIRVGALLGRELLTQLRKSRAVVLLWSEAASRSPWVQTEWLAAANLGKAILPLQLDPTELPQCLANTVRPPASLDDAIAELARTLRGRLPRGGSISASMATGDARLEARIARLAAGQGAVLDALASGDLGTARRRQRALDRPTRALAAAHPLHARVASLWAYHAKNAVAIEHDGELRAGIRIDDDRLDEARWRFLHALWLDPFDPSALNGLGTIAWFGHDLATAEFFVRAALEQAPEYEAARQDLELIRHLAARRRR